MDLIIASNNKHKIKEIKEILSPYFSNILSQSELDINLEVEEDADSFSGNAQKKARAIFSLTGKAAIADDSGLSVYALGGAPGVYSARYAGEPCDDKKNNALLLHNLRGQTDRRAKFVCSICLVSERGEFFGEGKIEGIILESERGAGGFGYDPLFFVPELNKTFAEAGAEEKNKISHRSRALSDLVKKL